MIAKYVEWVDKRYPQNYLIQKPVIGSVLLAFYCLLFLIIYKPFNLSESGKLNFEATMALYAFSMIPPHILLVYALRKIKFFSHPGQWTIRKELLAILLILAGLGIFIFAFGFLVQGPANRLNLATLMDSCKIVFLTCVILYGFLMLISVRNLDNINVPPADSNDYNKEIVEIKSKLKGEALTLRVSDLIYIESEGNYVVFHISQDALIRKETMRNSISEVEQMLHGIPFIVRTHRAFLVNIIKVTKCNGNSSGYRLQLDGTAEQIPVSRSNVKKFNSLYSSSR